MPNKFCYFGCNKYKKLSVFSVPKNEVLRNKWQKSLDVELFDNDVICEQHFCAEHIKKKNEITDKFGKIVCSAPLLRPRLMSNAVPCRLSAKNKFKSSENSTNQDSHYDSECEELQNFILLEHNYSSVLFDESKNLKSNSSNSVVIDFSTTEICQENESREPLGFIDKSDDKSILFDELIYWDLYLPPNWQTYLSHDKKCFGISEIIFIKQGDNLNSFLRKSIIISQHYNIMPSVTCNIMGKSISIDKLVNFNGYIESQDQLQKLIKEMALMKICKGLDLINIKKYNSFLYINDRIVLDNMLIKRHSECPVIISNGLHCPYCTRTIRNIYQRQRRLTEHSSPKRASLKTKSVGEKKLNTLHKRSNLYRKKSIVLKNKQHY